MADDDFGRYQGQSNPRGWHNTYYDSAGRHPAQPIQQQSFGYGTVPQRYQMDMPNMAMQQHFGMPQTAQPLTINNINFISVSPNEADLCLQRILGQQPQFTPSDTSIESPQYALPVNRPQHYQEHHVSTMHPQGQDSTTNFSRNPVLHMYGQQQAPIRYPFQSRSRPYVRVAPTFGSENGISRIEELDEMGRPQRQSTPPHFPSRPISQQPTAGSIRSRPSNLVPMSGIQRYRAVSRAQPEATSYAPRTSGLVSMSPVRGYRADPQEQPPNELNIPQSSGLVSMSPVLRSRGDHTPKPGAQISATSGLVSMSPLHCRRDRIQPHADRRTSQVSLIPDVTKLDVGDASEGRSPKSLSQSVLLQHLPGLHLRNPQPTRPLSTHSILAQDALPFDERRCPSRPPPMETRRSTDGSHNQEKSTRNSIVWERQNLKKTADAENASMVEHKQESVGPPNYEVGQKFGSEKALKKLAVGNVNTATAVTDEIAGPVLQVEAGSYKFGVRIKFWIKSLVVDSGRTKTWSWSQRAPKAPEDAIIMCHSALQEVRISWNWLAESWLSPRLQWIAHSTPQAIEELRVRYPENFTSDVQAFERVLTFVRDTNSVMAKLLEALFCGIHNLLSTVTRNGAHDITEAQCVATVEYLREAQKQFEDSWKRLERRGTHHQDIPLIAIKASNVPVLKRFLEIRPTWPKQQVNYLHLPKFHDQPLRQMVEKMVAVPKWGDTDSDDEDSTDDSGVISAKKPPTNPVEYLIWYFESPQLPKNIELVRFL